MAEGGFEMTEFERPEESVLDEYNNNNNNIHICIAPYGRNFRGAKGRVETTDVDEAMYEGPTVDILTEDKTSIHKLETVLETYKGEILAEQWERLKQTKVDAYLKVVVKRTGLLPTKQIYDEFYLG